MTHQRLFLLALGLMLLPCGLARGQRPSPPVEVAPIVQRSVTSSQTYVGTVMPKRRSVIGSAVDGRVKTFPRNEGDRVEAREVLAEIRDRTISLELAAREADREAARQAWLELKNGTRPEVREQAKSQLEAAEAIHALTKSRFERTSKLFERGSVTEDELAEVVSAHDAAIARLAEAKAGVELAKNGAREEERAQAEAKYESLKAECERLADQKERHKMVSPFAGYVVAEHTEEGAWVKRGDPIATVVELDEVDVQVMVLEQHINQVRIGSKTKVVLNAMPDHPLEGIVQLIVPDADIRSRTFPVKIRVKNEFKQGLPVLQSGMLARVTLELVEESALMVPKDALVLNGDNAYLLVAKPIGPAQTKGKQLLAQAVPVPVVKGTMDGTQIQVISEKLNPQQFVIVVGNERLPGPGSPAAPATVEVINPPAARGNANR